MAIIIASCSDSTNKVRVLQEGEKLFNIKTPAESGIDFINQITETEDNNHLVWESIYNGGGVGVGDINNDGLMDIYLAGNMTKDKLYLNKGNLVFEDITFAAGINEPNWSSGITFADVNNDGYQDIYVCKMSWNMDSFDDSNRANRLYINNKNNTFTESSKEYKINDKGHSTQASFFDYDKDGLLDLYVMNAPSHRYDQKLIYMNQKTISYDFSDHLYHNVGGQYEDVTFQVLGKQDPAFGLGLATQDFNDDGWTDIYVANDFEKPDLMYINDQIGGFTNELTKHLKHTSYSSMGMDVADINNDGFPDIAVLDMQSNDHVRSKTNMPSMDIKQFWQNVAKGYHFQFMANMLQLNNGQGFYSDIGQLSGMASTDWSWSILLSDMDNDGYKDALITNGINRNIKDNDFNRMMERSTKGKDFSFLDLAMKTKVEKVKNFAFKNNQGDLTFSDVSTEWGLDHDGFSFGAAYADFDNDGDLDVIVNNNNEVAQLYENLANGIGNYLRISTKDSDKLSLNAKVYIRYGDQVQSAENHNVRGYQSCSEPIVHFGLGSVDKIDELYVVFNNGKLITQKNVKVNQLLTFDIKDAGIGDLPSLTETNKLVNDISKQNGIEYFHVENEYNDFDNQLLIPHMETRNGPFTTVADINGDGREDLYIGASKGDFGLIYLQNSEGKMIYRPNPVFDADKQYEDMGSVLFDLDNDGDLDLYVASGGSEDKEGSANYEDRLYINQGDGLFERSKMNLPNSNASKVITIDVNNDGYLDLFVAGRMEGGKYPYSGTSHIMINDKGNLIDDPRFSNKSLGMVTSAIALDVNEDGQQDLVLVGEWMKPTFLLNNKGVFKYSEDAYLDNLKGWWFEIEAGDIDGDGVNEILLGNIGLNNKYHASATNTIKVYADDFDSNQKYDVVLAKNTKYGEVPVRGFQCSSEQLPYLRKKFDSYDAFAHANIIDILGDKKEKSLLLEANEFRSGYLKWNGSIYDFIPFPNQAQLSSIQGMVVLDVDHDGINDVVLAGNHFDAEVETTRHDASVGLILKGSKSGLKVVSPNESGFYTPGNVKDLVRLKFRGKECLFVTNNNSVTQMFEVR